MMLILLTIVDRALLHLDSEVMISKASWYIAGLSDVSITYIAVKFLLTK